MKNQKMKCCICGCEFEGAGNNPYPVVADDDAKCCDACNLTYVVTARYKCFGINEINKRIEILKAMRTVVRLGAKFPDSACFGYQINTINRLTNLEGCASFCNSGDTIKVYEGNGDGSDDAEYTFTQFVIKYQFELGREL